jgi:CO dehydrogenase maturation factor
VKVAVTGKGGVGKTTVSAALALCWARAGCRVVAVDADPDANLAGTLGYRGADIPPLTEMKQLIEDRVGGWGGFLKMNPKVDDIPERFGVDVNGVRVLVMGTIERGRRGCACPENVLVREVLGHLMLSVDDRVVVDMEAGLEHLGRGTAESVDDLLIVVEPGWAAMQTAARTLKLGRDLHIAHIHAVANKVRSDADLRFIRENLSALPVLGALPFDADLECDAREGHAVGDRPFHRKMEEIARALDQERREGS